MDDGEGCLRDSAGVYDLVIVTFFKVDCLKVKSFAEDLVVDLERDLAEEPVVVVEVEVDERVCGLGIMSNAGQAVPV